MSFAIQSAPEIFQHRMQELIEGMLLAEEVADDFIIVGYGETQEQVMRDHDKNLMAFLQLCQDRRPKLNIKKLTLKQMEVSFIGNVATGNGLRVDPGKVKAIHNMPAPTDKAGVQKLLGMVQYLSKYLPNMSNMTKPSQ